MLYFIWDIILHQDNCQEPVVAVIVKMINSWNIVYKTESLWWILTQSLPWWAESKAFLSNCIWHVKPSRIIKKIWHIEITNENIEKLKRNLPWRNQVDEIDFDYEWFEED